MGEKYWCCLGEIRRQITIQNCRECDKLADLPVGTYEYCEARKPYQMQICEALHDLIWWLKILWTQPKDFPYCLVAELFRVLGLQWGWSICFHHGKITRRLHIGLRRRKWGIVVLGQANTVFGLVERITVS